MGFAGALLPALYFGWLPVILVGAAMVISLSANTYITHKLGGVTGDTYGAVTELSELLLYAIIYLLP
jgi:adenosylcobinamide-GDP ribazoletransferase